VRVADDWARGGAAAGGAAEVKGKGGCHVHSTEQEEAREPAAEAGGKEREVVAQRLAGAASR